MPSDSGPVVGLEQSCIKPGHWLIEGYDVYRWKTGGWRAYHFGRKVGWFRTLREAREWIADRL